MTLFFGLAWQQLISPSGNQFFVEGSENIVKTAQNCLISRLWNTALYASTNHVGHSNMLFKTLFDRLRHAFGHVTIFDPCLRSIQVALTPRGVNAKTQT